MDLVDFDLKNIKLNSVTPSIKSVKFNGRPFV
jgi:hypothetical protein